MIGKVFHKAPISRADSHHAALFVIIERAGGNTLGGFYKPKNAGRCQLWNSTEYVWKEPDRTVTVTKQLLL
jgi:hypothetical protein